MSFSRVAIASAQRRQPCHHAFLLWPPVAAIILIPGSWMYSISCTRRQAILWCICPLIRTLCLPLRYVRTWWTGFRPGMPFPVKTRVPPVQEAPVSEDALGAVPNHCASVGSCNEGRNKKSPAWKCHVRLCGNLA
ncbi:hypothetical protein OBBRIDRAFT_230205 [Obba rivulosa]|uniref:Uncharacterized protein n=1 Tax=Obba rivulosa TaxID=1052685 RepID=A0A8E2DUV2_9APHY|nr:hypothetical protein OBBRIDRAFT_230205 [Obba rivulosa]